MMVLKCTVGLLLFSMMLTKPAPEIYNHTLNGIVIDKTSGKPLPDIYVYTVKGEEEALTNAKGEFKIVTWQKLPLTLHVRDLQKEYLQVKVTNPSERIVIKL